MNLFPLAQAMAQKMDELYSGLGEYFVFDRQKYTLEEFMGDVKAFKDLFKKAHDGILKEREATEKQARARQAREKQERERAERAAKKKALVDFNAPDDQVKNLFLLLIMMFKMAAHLFMLLHLYLSIFLNLRHLFLFAGGSHGQPAGGP